MVCLASEAVYCRGNGGTWSYVMGVNILVFSLQWRPLHLSSLHSGVEKRPNHRVNGFITRTQTHMHPELYVYACMCVELCSPCDDDDDADDADEPSFGVRTVWQDLPLLSWSYSSLICFYLPLVSTATHHVSGHMLPVPWLRLTASLAKGHTCMNNRSDEHTHSS